MSDEAIWTEEECANLNAFQRSNYVHPFTCGGDRMDDAHRKAQAERGGDFGELVATRTGWKCPACDYTQDWAHPHMFKGAPPDPFASLRKPRP